MSFPPYEAYKDSGVEWLGELPRHWQSGRIKTTTYLKGRVGWKGLTSEEYLEDGYAHLVTGTDFKSKFIDWTSCHCVERERYDDDPFIQLVNGDLLITKDGTIGKLALVTHLDRPACLNSGIFLVRPEGGAYLTSYMYWVLSSPSFKQFCDLYSFGSTIMHLYQNVFEQFTFPLPPILEQSDVADFLDRETAKIDALVQEQQRLIELLKEKRQAVISHAVTKGLNPDAPMNDSGIEWLGEVPEHWEVKALKRAVVLQRGHDLPAEARNEGSVPVVSSGGISAYHDQAITAGPTIVTGRYGTIGEFTYLEEPCWPLNTALYSIELYENSPIFLWFLLQANKEHFILNSLKAAVPGVDRNDVHPVKVSLPPRAEQDKIVAFLLEQSEQVDSLISVAETAIALLQERRSALISAAVTGKIDLRGVASLEAEAA